MMNNRFAAIVPAAGLSSRMGAFKPLLPFGSQTVIEASVENALSTAERAVIVLGRRGDEIRDLLMVRFGERLIFAANPAYAAASFASGGCFLFWINLVSSRLVIHSGKLAVDHRQQLFVLFIIEQTVFVDRSRKMLQPYAVEFLAPDRHFGVLFVTRMPSSDAP